MFLTSDSKLDLDRLKAEIRQDFTELEGWASVVISFKKMMEEEQDTTAQEIAKI
jgi:nanoRNase/pAp phosphatase (c-di-AMP/oligoRNAs hydrolase)